MTTSGYRNRWSGSTTASLLLSLQARVNAGGDDTEHPIRCESRAEVNTPISLSSCNSESVSMPTGINEAGGTAEAEVEKGVEPLGLLALAAAVDDAATSTCSSPVSPASPVLCDTGKDAARVKSTNDTSSSPMLPSTAEQRIVKEVYEVVKTKVDITCGGDGYGMTGNCTLGAMTRLFDVLRVKFELNVSSYFMVTTHQIAISMRYLLLGVSFLIESDESNRTIGSWSRDGKTNHARGSTATTN